MQRSPLTAIWHIVYQLNERFKELSIFPRCRHDMMDKNYLNEFPRNR
jgi:hypothetical protein